MKSRLAFYPQGPFAVGRPQDVVGPAAAHDPFGRPLGLLEMLVHAGLTAIGATQGGNCRSPRGDTSRYASLGQVAILHAMRLRLGSQRRVEWLRPMA